MPPADGDPGGGRKSCSTRYIEKKSKDNNTTMTRKERKKSERELSKEKEDSG